ncbi:MAG TPA: hypothetical protein PKO09_14655 [Anaerolineae bacterium]|nr:hypothetical protein [Anaerolineae bacterium]
MLRGLINRVVGDPNEREIRKLQALVEAINAYEPDYERLSNAELRALSDGFRTRLAEGAGLDSLLPEAFAAVREAAKRTVSMRPFDVQMLGGIVLHQGQVAEMRTGEGKTLVATLPMYLNALAGQGAHLVTVNDYLARRDTLWMGAIYHLLGLSIGLLQSGSDQPAYLFDPAYRREPYPGLRPVDRRQAYDADITYGTNNEFGFDYLRDNLSYSLDGRVQRELHFAIVDEVDNIFIDEARTPLIISGRSAESVEDYRRFAEIAPRLEAGVHYELDEKERTVFLTDEGLAEVERQTGIDNIYDEANERFVHYMEQALKAQVLFREGRDYIRQQKRIILVDPHTGRLMPDRRLSEGLHQAIEAKERVPVQARDMVNATITIQNYFRMYRKLAGMSGTAMTEAEEFFKIYKLDVLPIPTNRPMKRQDETDVVYRSEEAKLRAVVREILTCHVRGQPVLVGTTSVQMSERLSNRLTGERLQMAGIAPRIAYTLQDANMTKEEKARLREAQNVNLEASGSTAWRKLMRDLGLDPNPLAPEHLEWLADYLHLPAGVDAQRTLERSLRDGIPHQVLNAKEHAREAGVIARAGEPGAVTIATNMAGRGVDIRLGGELSEEVIERAHQVLRAQGLNPFRATSAQMDSAVAEVDPQYARRRDAVLAAGGLHVLGTERHEARRIDNQLRGRSGRQGEPGSSRFFLSLEDDLMRRFGRQEILSRLMEQMGEDFPIEHGLVAKTIERAQTSVEGYNFDIRKRLLDYDDVLSRQRETIYAERLRILQSHDLHGETWKMLAAHVKSLAERLAPKPEQHAALFAEMDRIVPTYELEILSKATGGARDRRTLSVLRFASTDEGFRTSTQALEASRRLLRCAFSLTGSLSVFPSFSCSFIADHLEGGTVEAAQSRLQDLGRATIARYGEQVGRLLTNAIESASRQHEDQLARQREVLDSRIDDYVQISEERGKVADARGVAQYLERNFELKVHVPDGAVLESEQLRQAWGEQITGQLHQRMCAELIERIVRQLPFGIRLDRFRPSLLAPARLSEEVSRVMELATKQSRGTAASGSSSMGAHLDGSETAQLTRFVESLKAEANLDVGRLDRLAEHLLASTLDTLIARFLGAMDSSQARARRDLERIRQGLAEARRSGAPDLLSLLREINGLVYLEFSDIEELLAQALDHEYDRWAQRQLADIETAVVESPVTATDWSSVTLHLLNTWSTLRQGLVLPRLPFCQMAAVLSEGMSPEQLEGSIHATLGRINDLREGTWGAQELQEPRKRGAWLESTLQDLPDDIFDGFARSLGEGEMDAHQDTRIDELPPELYERVGFVAAMVELDRQAIGTLPSGAEIASQLGKEMEARLLDTPVGELDAQLRSRIRNRLRERGDLEDAQARLAFMERPIGTWDRRAMEAIARAIGTRQIEAAREVPLSQLAENDRQAVLGYLRRQRRFVDEERVQRFLVHESLDDLPADTRDAALAHVARGRLERLGRRKIANLDVATRQVVLNAAQRLGLLSAQGGRGAVNDKTIAELEGDHVARFALYMARQAFGDGKSLGELPERLRRAIHERLRNSGSLDDPERVKATASMRLDDLGEAVAAELWQELASAVRDGLSARTMDELPTDTRALVHRALSDKGYFVDAERVGWYERRTLAQLPSDLLRGLEQHLGQMHLRQMERVPFRDLTPELREGLFSILDSEGILPERAERLRLTQTGRLADLSRGDWQSVAQMLGRRWLVRIREMRPAALPDGDRQAVWAFIRDQGLVSDRDKEELFGYMTLEEFGPEVRQDVEAVLLADLRGHLDRETIGELPAPTRTQVEAHLARTGWYVNPSLAHSAETLPVTQLPPDLGSAICDCFAQCISVDATLLEGTLRDLPSLSPDALGNTPIDRLPASLQAELWRYLDGAGYFLDDLRRRDMLEKRLGDLGEELLVLTERDLADQIRGEVAGKPIAELTDDLRQALREGVEAAGVFESGTAQDRALQQPLGTLSRVDLDALAVEIGAARLGKWSGLALRDLPPEDLEPLLEFVQRQDWFLDPQRQESLDASRLRDLDVADLAADLCREQIARLERQNLSELTREQRMLAWQLLFERGVRVEESQMRTLRPRRVGDLELETSQSLAWFLGTSAIQEIAQTRVKDLSTPLQGHLSQHLGRRVMSRVQRRVLLDAISRLWIDYLTDIEDLRRGIGLEAYGQRDPLVEYKRKAYELFEQLTENIRRTVVRSLFRQAAVPLEE